MNHENPNSRTQKLNQERYDEWSKSYDQYPNPTVAADELHFNSMWSVLGPSRVLEIGCGTGRNTSKLVALGCIVDAIEVSPGMLGEAKEKIKSTQVNWTLADFLTLSVASSHYDFALCSLVLEHIDQLDLFFEKVSSALKSQGYFYLSEIHPARTAEGVMAHFKNYEGEEVHLVSFAHTELDISQAAERAGLVVKKCITCLGDEKLTAMNPKWKKHEGKPMIQIWEFQKS